MTKYYEGYKKEFGLCIQVPNFLEQVHRRVANIGPGKHFYGRDILEGISCMITWPSSVFFARKIFSGQWKEVERLSLYLQLTQHLLFLCGIRFASVKSDLF